MTLAESILPNIQKAYPRELWGEAWLCALREEGRYDLAKATDHFWPWVRYKFRLHLMDLERGRRGRMNINRKPNAVTQTKRRLSKAVSLQWHRVKEDRGMLSPEPEQDHGELAGRALAAISERADLYAVGRMVASGMTIQQIAAGIGASCTTVSNAKKAMRSIVNAPGFAITEPVKCA